MGKTKKNKKLLSPAEIQKRRQKLREAYQKFQARLTVLMDSYYREIGDIKKSLEEDRMERIRHEIKALRLK